MCPFNLLQRLSYTRKRKSPSKPGSSKWSCGSNWGKGGLGSPDCSSNTDKQGKTESNGTKWKGLTTREHLLDVATSISSRLLSLGEPNRSIGSSLSCSRIFRLFATDCIAHIHSSLRVGKFHKLSHITFKKLWKQSSVASNVFITGRLWKASCVLSHGSPGLPVLIAVNIKGAFNNCGPL